MSLENARYIAGLVVAAAIGCLVLAAPSHAQTAAPADAQTSSFNSVPTKPGEAAAPESIRPFRFTASEEALTDLRRRVNATRWPEKELVADDTQGVQLGTMQKLAQYWGSDYDWHKCEAKLNSFPQFITQIDGLEVHFIHVRSKEKNAMPLIITHGWPGSILEQMKVIGPLTDPVAFGGKAEDAFDVVIPSMPGYGFSGKPTATGWDAIRIARANVALMKRLGYTKFVAQGGDWGALITDEMGVLAPPELLAIHTNMPGAVPPEISKALAGGPLPSGLSDEEKRAYDRLDFFYKQGLAYAQEMGKRPQTLYGIADSPIGLAAWILDHDQLSYQLIARVFDGKPEGLSKDDVLDNITLYWLTNTGVSSARLYWENKLAFFDPKNVTIPVGVSAFRDELYQCPKSWAEKAYPKLVFYNQHDKGCHFAAWEQPEALVADVRATFKSVR